MRPNGFRVLVALVVMGFLGGCGKQEEKRPAISQPIIAPPATNVVQPAAPAATELELLPETVAELQGTHETPVTAKAAGYLVRQVYKENAFVTAGDVLFLLDPRRAHPEAIIPGKNDLGLLAVVAPFSGAAGHALHGPGDWINARDQLTTVAAVDPVHAVFSVPKPYVFARQAFVLSLGDGSDYAAKGKLASVTAGATSLEVGVEFPNPNRALQPGQFVKIRGVIP